MYTQAKEGDQGIITGAIPFGSVSQLVITKADGARVGILGDWRPIFNTVEALAGQEVKVFYCEESSCLAVRPVDLQ